MAIRDFMQLIQKSPELIMHAKHLVEEIGAETFGSLINAGILERDDPADWYPCPTFEGDDCPMRVVPNPSHPTHSHIAVCGNSPPQCLDVYLDEEDLEQVMFSLAGLARVIREQLRINGDLDIENEVHPGVLHLGESSWGGVHREVFLATEPSSRGFPAFLTLRRKERKIGSLVLAPSRRWIKQQVIDQYGHGDRVELVFLEVLLTVRGGNLVVDAQTVLADWSSTSHESQVEPFCKVIDHNGERLITEAECRDLQARAIEYDLFIDMMTSVNAGRYRAGRRDLNDKFEENPLTTNQAAALVELISIGKPIRADELKSIESTQPAKRLEEARRLIDINTSRYRWRSIKTLRADTSEAKQFFFDPPNTLRYSVILPR